MKRTPLTKKRTPRRPVFSPSTRKIRHTKHSAEQTLQALLQLGDFGLNIYPCPHCDAWHIGHRPGNYSERKRDEHHSHHT
ncbi:hypothetical protein KOR42_41600 [Thalassoglobus neptunius]|uniref:Uncharacterized protein n=1 Tax=Thalassoglobus neptunius TaxID=1938619 RepID=A0A5C5WBY9_9PLAN|nr:hypothetical protein KOR42_41600 [Thalassoglobus neptunius]